MAKRPNTKSRKTYLGQPGVTKMPGDLGQSAPPAAAQDAGGAAESAGRTDLAIAMDDYPGGRGGMNKVAMPAGAAQSAAVVNRPGVPIGRRPPVTKMP